MNQKRQDKIYQEILEHNECRVKDLAALFQVSTETIRKDLDHLEALGLITKNHGSAKILNEYLQLPMDIKMNENSFEKEKIARAAIECIQDHSVIYFDPSTICVKTARYLPFKKHCTIVTNSLAIAQSVLHTKHDLLLLGGHVIKKSNASTGFYTNQIIDTLHIDYAFHGTDGFYGFTGPSTFSKEELDTKRHILEHSKHNILVCDHSKFTKSGSYQFAKFHEFQTMITNDMSEKERTYLSEIAHIINIKTTEETQL